MGYCDQLMAVTEVVDVLYNWSAYYTRLLRYRDMSDDDAILRIGGQNTSMEGKVTQIVNIETT